MVLLLLVLACLRFGVGADYFSYQFLYSRINPSIFVELAHGADNQEIGFRLLGSLIKGLGFSYQFYLIIISAVNLLFISLICKKYSKNPTLSLTVYYSFYYLVWTFSGLRQGLVLAIGMYYLLKYINQNKSIRFFIIIFILTLIHYSALILIIYYLVTKIEFRKKTLIIITICSILFSLIPWGNILKIFSGVPIIDKVLIYIDADYSIGSILNFQSLGRIAFLVIALFYYNTYKMRSSFSKKLINIYIFSIIIYFLFQFSELTAARLSIYGKFLDIILLVNVYYLYKDRINKILYIVLLGLLMLLYLNKDLSTLVSETGMQTEDKINIPYTNIINKEDIDFDNRFYDILYKE